MGDYDVLIVGGGVMGSSTAYHLIGAEPSISVGVIERDDSYEKASTVLSDGNVRVQFNLDENIRISQHTLEVLEHFSDVMATVSYEPDPGMRKQGNLFMVDERAKPDAIAGLNKQREMGCDVEWLDADDIASRFATYRSRDLVGGTLGRDDGSVDPTAVLRGYRAKAVELGVDYLNHEVDHLLIDNDRAVGVGLVSGEVFRARSVVVTAGAWTSDLLATAGVEIPVVPYMRTVYVVSTPFQAEGLPSIFLPSGVYAIGESENVWLMGWSRPEDPTGFDFTPTSRERFENLIWPELVQHLPAFDRLHVERSWAGLYAVNTLDHNAIVGEWPGIDRLFLATGFSGHGFQQAPATGRYLCESVLGLTHELDLDRLGPQRVIDGEPLHEHAGRVI